MNYELERKINDKVDKWEFHALQRENQDLKNHISELNRKIGELESVNSNRYYVLEKLLNLLANDLSMAEISNDLYELRNNL